MGISFKSVIREFKEMKDGISGVSRKGSDLKHLRRQSYIVPEASTSLWALVDQGRWADMPPELLLDIIRRVEASGTSWPARRNAIACASVCRSWRGLTKEIVRTPEQCGLLTFPISLKQPGPRDAPIQCFIRRERETSTYRLYLGLSPALSGNTTKMLLAAKKVRRTTRTEFLISLNGNDFSRSSKNFVGKLRSNFLGTKFTMYESKLSRQSVTESNFLLHRRIRSEQVCTIAYELNFLRTRGPRRMLCIMNSIPTSATEEGGTAPTPMEFTGCSDVHFSPLSYSNVKKSPFRFSSSCSAEPRESIHSASSPLVLKNKAPRWHEQLQCWCLNFKGRVTVASVKNFQLVAAVEPGKNIAAAEQEKVILQFGKIGRDIFTVDYCYPLSAFQAFVICLSSFDTKPACE
ncbi:hypothetical protein SLE2022_216050 [Rubroshorea leprosula]